MSDPIEPVVLVTGATGQVGFELLRSLQGLGRIVAPARQALDLADFDQIRRVMSEVKPTLIINPAAYTAVDQAETDVDVAMRMNGIAPGVLAEEAKRIGAAVIHYSTDYVFDGTKDGAYDEDDAVGPLNVYGKSKLAGEQAIQQVGGRHLVFRTSWVYGTRGRNFLRTMLRLAEQQPQLRVVADQVGAPTWSGTIAAMTAHVAAGALDALDTDRSGEDWWDRHAGLYHLSASGSTSWAGFADAIFELAGTVTQGKRPDVMPIASSEYPMRAARPMNSRLSTARLTAAFGLRPPHWRDALQLCVANL